MYVCMCECMYVCNACMYVMCAIYACIVCMSNACMYACMQCMYVSQRDAMYVCMYVCNACMYCM